MPGAVLGPPASRAARACSGVSRGMAPGKVSTRTVRAAGEHHGDARAEPVLTQERGRLDTAGVQRGSRAGGRTGRRPMVATSRVGRPSRASPCAKIAAEAPITRSAEERSCSAWPNLGTTSPRRIRSGFASPSTRTSVTVDSLPASSGKSPHSIILGACSCSFSARLPCCPGDHDCLRRRRLGRVHPPAAARPAVLRRPARASSSSCTTSTPRGWRWPSRWPSISVRHHGRGRHGAGRPPTVRSALDGRRLRDQHGQHRRPRRHGHRLRRARVASASGRRSPTPSASAACSAACAPSGSSTRSPATWPRSARTPGCSTTPTRWR